MRNLCNCRWCKTIPKDHTGQTGRNDYSRWKYAFTPAYAGTIREGINRITAKLICQANPANLTKFYSINVTGMNEIVPTQSSAISTAKIILTERTVVTVAFLPEQEICPEIYITTDRHVKDGDAFPTSAVREELRVGERNATTLISSPYNLHLTI